MISISLGSTYVRGLSMQLEPGITASDKPSSSTQCEMSDSLPVWTVFSYL